MRYMTMSTISTVQAIKGSLGKLLPADSLTDESIEQCKDMLGQLDKCDITLEILTKSLIGTVVSKFKVNKEVGPIAKALVKKWKKIAKEGPQTSTAAMAKKQPVKAERRESVNSVIEAIEEDWGDLQPHRQTTCKKLHSLLRGHKQLLLKQGINGSAIDQLAVERASEVEAAIQQKFINDKQEYLSKARSLCFNIKKNGPLASQVVLGHIPGEELINMTSEQLASDEKRKEMAERMKKLREH